ncbi:type II secretion system F family protein [Burkholderia seminalis]|uniref:type II secretion system F family protein n=1 Tax=Burkholderia seminalis TaxID=488731 RepID=UPI00158365FA|nr:type II secretion system F family protein [Burkholderia seminalis]MCA8306767.1 type II secretion system F family protein [Burkholderia seminalis]MCA8435263.1 type II secretion system F family protein [Burkholderia seminalis]
MTYFYYRILFDDGVTVAAMADIPVSDDFEARTWLEARYKGIVVKLRQIPLWVASIYRFVGDIFLPGIKRNDVAGFLRDLALMASAGIPILESIAACLDDTEMSRNRSMYARIQEIRHDLEAGVSVTEAFNRQAAIFSDTVRSLIAIGDETGSMDKRLLEAADHLERIIGMRSSAKQALIYPAFVFSAIIGAAAFWIYYVIPNLSGLFKQMNVKLPKLTIAVLGFADWCVKNGALILGIVAAGLLLLVSAWKFSIRFRRLVYVGLHKLPISKTILRSSGLAFFAEYLSILIGAGLDIVRSFSILQRTITDEYYKARIIEIRYLVERGERISAAMRRVGGFPSMIVRMIAVGENSGSLDRQLQHLAREYRSRLDRIIGSLSELMKPLIIVVAGAFFVVIIIALLLPIYDLVKQAMINRY